MPETAAPASPSLLPGRCRRAFVALALLAGVSGGLGGCGAGGMLEGFSAPDVFEADRQPDAPSDGGSGAAMSAGELAFADEVLRLVNEERGRAGLGPVAADPQLAGVAYAHSVDMDVRNFTSHTNPSGQGPGDRLRAAGVTGLRGWGENIAWGQRTPAAVMHAWMTSEGHRDNILTPGFTHLGVGVHAPENVWWTQVFASR